MRDGATTGTQSTPGAELAGRALVDHIAQQIQMQIMTGELAPGERLRQEALAEEFGVSRTPVREALRQLQASGLLEVEPRRGAVVRGPSVRDIREAYFLRAELEGIAAELAAEAITDEQLARLGEAAALFRASVEHFTEQTPPALADAEWPAANDMFHEVILEAAGNLRLYEAVRHLHLGFPRNLTWVALSASSRLLRENAAEHEQIFEAIEHRQPAAARKAMRRHIARSGELVARHFERTQVADRPV
ncbi:MAG: GntR family transcriptional regulator [Solirubrobacteraceae bacterium]